jgi:large subunit ribosomal protein L5
MSRLLKRFQEEILPALKKKHEDRNVMQLPVLKKIVIHMGIAEASKDKSILQAVTNELALLSGQKPVVMKAKRAISNFKLREGQPIGLKVTLRGKRMYDFFDRFCNIVCPRIHDFRGFSQKGDGMGNLSIGLEDQQAFPEINLDEVKKSQGMNITFVTSARNDEDCVELLEHLGFPFKEKSAS